MIERLRGAWPRWLCSLLLAIVLVGCRSDRDDDVWAPRTRLTTAERAARPAKPVPPAPSDTVTIVLRPDPRPEPASEPASAPEPEPAPPPRPRLAIVASGTGEAIASEPVDYTFTVRNLGDGAARDVVLRVDLGDGIETLGDAGEPTFVADAIAPGSWRTFRVRGMASVGRHTVTASVSASDVEPVLAEPIVTVVTRVALELVHDGPDSVAFEADVASSIEVRNDGSHAAHGVEVAVALPVGLDWRDASAPGVIEGRTIVWPLGALAAGERRRLHYRVGAGRVPQVTLVATATARGARVTAPLTWRARAVPRLAVDVVDLEDPVAPAGAVTYVVTVSNRGTAPDRDVSVSCGLPVGMRVVSVRGPGPVAREGRAIRFAPLATLAPGARISWAIVARVDATRSTDVTVTARGTSATSAKAVAASESTRFGP